MLAGCASMLAQGQVGFHRMPGKIEVVLGGKPFTNFYYGPERAKPFLHPLRTTSGVVVTRGFPIEKIEGESTDHIWHHGLWYGHGDISGADFWRDLPGKTGRLEVTKVATAGKSIRAEINMVTVAKQILGTMVEQFGFARSGANHIVDVRVTIRADKGQALKLGDTEEGALGFRFADEFREDRGAVLSNSDGLTGTKEIWGKRARWVDYSTQIKGEKAGVVIFDHPKNPKHPTFWHARGYGLNAANPFGEHDFYKDKTRDGSVTVPQGGTIEFRYRVVIHPGMLDSIEPEKLAQDFAREVNQ
jgi:hypothetical protein